MVSGKDWSFLLIKKLLIILIHFEINCFGNCLQNYEFEFLDCYFSKGKKNVCVPVLFSLVFNDSAHVFSPGHNENGF